MPPSWISSLREALEKVETRIVRRRKVPPTLPPDILRMIFDYAVPEEPFPQDPPFHSQINVPGFLDKCHQLSHFSLVCSSWVEPAQEALYRHILIRRPTGLTYIAKLLESGSLLAGKMTRLDITLCLNKHDEVEMLKTILSHLISLRRCCISLPSEAPPGTTYTDYLPTSANQQLVYLTIETAGWNFWIVYPEFPMARINLADLQGLPKSLIHLDMRRIVVFNFATLEHPNLSTLCLFTLNYLVPTTYENVLIEISRENQTQAWPTVLRNLPKLSRLIIQDSEVFSVRHLTSIITSTSSNPSTSI